MCGRFTLTSGPELLIQAFRLSFFPEEYEPGYNIAPTQPVLSAVHTSGGRKAGYIRWGLIPFWVQDPEQWKPLMNARGESLESKASFKHLLDKRRCLIFADGFYEWKREGRRKQPVRIVSADEKPFAFAGLWDRNQKGNGEIVTCTIITTESSGFLREIHDRMPVILQDPEEIERWVNIDRYPFAEVKDLIRPLPEGRLKSYPVTDRINSPKFNGIECIQPLMKENGVKRT
jgi:Uncharacterised ACR, COG2135.